MGNTETTTQQQQLQKVYRQIQKFEHPALGCISRLQKKNAQQQKNIRNINNNDLKSNLNTFYILRQSKYAHQKECNNAIERLKNRKKISGKKSANNILKLYEYRTDKQNQICGMTFYIYSFYEYFDYDLSDIINERRAKKNYFTEKEISHFLISVCHGLIFIHDYHMKNLFLSRDSIVYNSNTQTFKVLDTDIAKQIHPYLKIINGLPLQTGVYLAPELIEDLINRNQEPDNLYSPKADVFTLGVLLLEMCTLNPMQKYYDYTNLSMDLQQIQALVRTLPYSQYFKDIISGMLDVYEDERLGLLSIKEKLSVYEDSHSNNRSTATGNLTEFAKHSNITQKTVKNQRYITSNVSNIYSQLPMPSLGNVPTPSHNFRPEYQDRQKGYSHNNYHNYGNNVYYPVPHKPADNIYHEKTLSPRYEIQNDKQYNGVGRNRAISFDVAANKNQFYQPQKFKNQYERKKDFHTFNQQNIIDKPYTNTNQQKQPLVKPTLVSPFQSFTNDIKPLQNGLPKKQTNISNQHQVASLSSVDQSWNTQHVLTSMQAINEEPYNNYSQCKKEQIKGNNVGSPSQKITDRFGNEKNQLDYSGQDIMRSQQHTPIRKIQALQEMTHKRNTIVEILNEISEESDGEDNQNQKNYNHNLMKNNNGPQSFRPIQYGKHHFTNGATYEGQFDEDGNFCGSGVLYYPNHQICYSGNWKKNCFHGFGVLYNQNSVQGLNKEQTTNYENFAANSPHMWKHYEGEFKMDKKNGFGTLVMKNGDKFSGSFSEDIIQGYGTFSSQTGKIISGLWHNNMLKKI